MVNPSGGSARRGAELALALIFISRRSSCERFVIRALGVISCHHVRRVWADGKAYRLQKVIIPANLNLLHHTPRGRAQVSPHSPHDASIPRRVGATRPRRAGASPRGRGRVPQRRGNVKDEFDALADALERARALDSGPPPRKSELERHFSKKPSREGGRRAERKPSREGGRRAADAKPSREGGRRPQKPPSRSGSDRAVLGAPAAAGAARGYWLDRGTNTDGRRGSATYWRDRAAATEKPSRGRDQGRKVSPRRDQSGKPAKGDRRRREAGIFTL